MRIIDGPNKGRKGTIVHIFKNVVFLYSPEQSGTNGLFVDKTRNLLILGAELLRGSNEVSKEKRSRAKIGNPRHDDMYNKLVIITSGPYKGQQGIVVDIDKSTAKIELSAKAKIVNVERSMIKDAALKLSMRDSQPQRSEAGSRTPAYLPQSPQWMPGTPAPQSPGYGDGK